jgi:hypothetical protein
VFRFDFSEQQTQLRSVFSAQWRMLAGLAFMIMAMAAIQYDEQIAPEVNRVAAGLDHVTADFRTKLASFTL